MLTTSVAAVVVGVLALSLYRKVNKTAENAEAITGSIRTLVSAPLNPIQMFTELVGWLMAWVRERRSQQRRSEDDDG